MSYLIFDTETTGKYDFKSPAFAQHQPRICQIAGQLIGRHKDVIAQFSLLIKPDGWTIPDEAEDIHGISTEKCEEYGIPIIVAMSLLNNMARCSTYVVGHNISFDIQMVKREMTLLKKDLCYELMESQYCTMQTMTPICKLPGPRGFKWPKLIEAYNHCFGKDFENAHDAMGDVLATREVLFWIIENNHFKP